ncbi:hypothetical protein BpHYR1_050884, partial [Brachionus plicatilis]
KRQIARFPIAYWNLYERVKEDLPRTNNNIESWHSRIKPDARNNLTLSKVIELFRLEQSNMESYYALLSTGEILSSTRTKQNKKNQKIKLMVEQYTQNKIGMFLDGMGENLKSN